METIILKHIDTETFEESSVEMDKIQHDIAMKIQETLNKYLVSDEFNSKYKLKKDRVYITMPIIKRQEKEFSIGIMLQEESEQRAKYYIFVGKRQTEY